MKKFMSIILTVTMAGAILIGCGKKQENVNSLEAVQKRVN